MCHENQQLKADIDKRESTLKNLIYRYDQSERKVREFIKTTLRYWLTYIKIGSN